ncbi:MAG: proline--tRNA ligase [Solobacterium sp.]|nr:proline--tRNA ligase [Solobacterium sp.]
MRLNNSYFFTLREDVKDEDSISSNLLVRAGFIKKSSSGVYMMLPMGLRVLNKINQIIREEMDKTGCQELLMPALIPEEVYVDSGRRAGFGSSMFSLQDRKGQPYVLGPTHEELFAIAAKMKIQSYKDMPFSLYQIETKYRDEPRPRYGLIRVREFQMKDAYTFDVDEAGLDVAYQKQFNAYKNIMDRLHLEYVIVKADTGVMGGLLSEEFQALAPIGEDILVLCDSCDFASNIEIAQTIPSQKEKEEEKELEKVETPHCSSIEEVSAFLNLPQSKCMKALLMNVDGEFTVFFVRGDRELNEAKALRLLNAKEISFADDALIATSNACPGFTGPIGLNARKVIDQELLTLNNLVCGANEVNYHYQNVNPKDYTYDVVGDIVNVMEGDVCPICGGKIHFAHGIEVGNTFKLGTKYSKALGLQYLDSSNTLQYVWMGSYGIGPARAMAALVEQNADENGINWPSDLAPYQVAIVPISMKDEEQVRIANELYEACLQKGLEVLIDDRDERPGVKFKDMELIGIPYRITVGKGVKDNLVELKPRVGDKIEVPIEEAIEKLIEMMK